MLNRVVIIGASAGGVEALKSVVRELPPDFNAAVVIALHLHPYSRSYLAEILDRAGLLPVTQAEDGMALQARNVYVAPPDYHLLVDRHRLRLSHGPKENRHRPSINSMFRSAAKAFGRDAIGVILTGSLDDGTLGLWEIKRAGGITVVQDPEDALFPEMPQNAMAHVEIDFIVKLSQIPPLLTTLVSEPLMEKVATGTLREEAGGHDPREEGTLGMHSVATDFTCPECHGAIREQRFGTVLQYSCRIGHTYTGNTMLEAHVDAEENALWGAVVALEEGAELSKRMAQVAPDTKEVFERQAELRRAHAKALRNMMAEISLSRKT